MSVAATKASILEPPKDDLRQARPRLAVEINKMISHPVFREWLTDPQET